MPQLVGMQAGDARPRAASVQHLHDAVTRERAAVAEPQLGARGVRMRAPQAQVAIQRAGGALAVRAGALTERCSQPAVGMAKQLYGQIERGEGG